MPSPVHLSLAPAHRRGHGSFYAALACGEISAAAVERLLAAHPLPLADGDPAVYAVDGSVWARCDAETSPERGFYHHPSRHSNGQPIGAGWLYQWVAQVRLTTDSWTAPLSVERVPPGANVNEVAAAQGRRVVARRPADGRLPLFAFDAG
ncbi:MAG: transposase [Chloroflexota bacterium]